ncbi:MAG: antitoxin, partial [Solirubrobacteraceae bacterium]
LLAAAKRRARERGLTLGELVEEALRVEAARWRERAAGPPLPVFKGKLGVKPGVDLTSNRATHEFLDEGVPLDKRR